MGPGFVTERVGVDPDLGMPIAIGSDHLTTYFDEPVGSG